MTHKLATLVVTVTIAEKEEFKQVLDAAAIAEGPKTRIHP